MQSSRDGVLPFSRNCSSPSTAGLARRRVALAPFLHRFFAAPACSTAAGGRRAAIDGRGTMGVKSSKQQQEEAAEVDQDDVIASLTEVHSYPACRRSNPPRPRPIPQTSHMRCVTPSNVLAAAQPQLEEFKEAFDSYDTDGGGAIEASELKALMASVGNTPNDEEVSEMIRIAGARQALEHLDAARAPP